MVTYSYQSIGFQYLNCRSKCTKLSWEGVLQRSNLPVGRLCSFELVLQKFYKSQKWYVIMMPVSQEIRSGVIKFWRPHEMGTLGRQFHHYFGDPFVKLGTPP